VTTGEGRLLWETPFVTTANFYDRAQMRKPGRVLFGQVGAKGDEGVI